VVAAIIAFIFRKVNKESVLYHWPQTVFKNIGF